MLLHAILSVLIKLYTFLHNNSFCNTFGANVYSHPVPVKEQIEDKTTSLLVQIDNRIRILVMLQIMMLNISSPGYVITKISAIISRYLTAKFEQ